MVFSGKPSTGCQMCRTRRIKCDEARPACNQCVRTVRACPGYKSQIDLLFRNETGASAAEKRARTAARKMAAASTASTAGPSQQQQQQQQQQQVTKASAAQKVPGAPSSSSLSSQASSSAAAAASPVTSTQAGSFSSFSVVFETYPGPATASSSSSKKTSQTRKPAANKSSSRAGGSRARAQNSAGRAGGPGGSANIRIEPLNHCARDHQRYMVDSLASASMVVAHHHSPCNAYGSFDLSRSRGYVEEEEEAIVDIDNAAPDSHAVANNRLRLKYGGEGAILPALTPPPEDLAVHHFVANYVLVPYQKSRRGYLDFIPPLIKSVNSSLPTASPKKPPPSEAAQALSFAFQACALASLGTRVSSNSFSFADKALSAYTRALATTHCALRDPALRRADNTLAAVLLLSIFENITTKQLGLFAWGSHIEGAVEIVKARSREQNATPTGRSLFFAVRSQMIIHSLASGKAPADDYAFWFGTTVNDVLAARCQRLSFRTAALRAETTKCMDRVAACTAHKTPEAVAEVRALAARAAQLDRDCDAWTAGLTSDWAYYAIAVQGDLPPAGPAGPAGTIDYAKVDVFPGRVDVYPDLYICALWNMWRSTRLCLSTISVRCAAWMCWPADYRTTDEYATAARLCSEMTAGIIASVPFSLGYHKKYGPAAAGGGTRRDKKSAAATTSTTSTTSTTPSPEPYLPTPSGSDVTPPLQSDGQTTAAAAAAAAAKNEHAPVPPPATASPDSTATPRWQYPYLPGSCSDEVVPPPAPVAGWLCGDDSDLKGLSGSHLAWPLANVSCLDYATEDQRAWVRGRLKFISSAIGVRYAGLLSEVKFFVPSMVIRRDRMLAQQAQSSRADGPSGQSEPDNVPSTPYAHCIRTQHRVSPESETPVREGGVV